MRARPKAKPCPGCAKPIRLDAANCWFCGEVFNTVPCVGCSSPVQKGSVTCWFCGATVADVGRAADSPAPLPSPGASEAIQTSPRPLYQREEPPVLEVAGIKNCPRCAAVIPLSAAKCKHCGIEMTVGGASNRWGPTSGYTQPHAGRTLLAQAILSLLSVAILPLSPLADGIGVVLAAINFLIFGVILGPLAWMRTNHDLNAMRDGRMNPTGVGLTLAARMIAAVSTILTLMILAYCCLVFLSRR